MKKKNLVKWAWMLSATVVMTSCGLDMPKEEQTSYETMTVKQTNLDVPVKFSAKMKGQRDVTITPQVSGQLMEIRVQEGQQVQKGQVLFVIDSRNSKLELESAQANLQAALAKMSSAKLEYESNKNLFEKKIVSSYTLNDSENSYKQAIAAVAQARAAVNTARVNLSFCTITSPVTGAVGEIPVRAGDQVSPASQLTIVSGNTMMNAEFSVPETVIETAVAEGYNLKSKHTLEHIPEATFLMKNGTEYKYKGKVTSATGVVNASTGTIALKATFPNPDGQLYSGIQGTVVMKFTEKNAIVVPLVAVVKLQDRQQVYKVKADSTATAVEVTTQDAGNGQDCIVVTGLKSGDRIVTVGANNVQEGQKVLFPAVAKEEK